MSGVTLNGNKILDGYDPEFFNITALEPRVTQRCDATKGARRRSSSVRKYTYTPEGQLSAEQVKRRIYERGW